MRIATRFFLVLLALSAVVLAQGEFDAPVNWETYQIAQFKLSIDFPKVPIRFEQQDTCNEMRTDYFVAYARERVYKLMVVSRQRRPANVISMCRSSSRFGQESLESRRNELANSGGIPSVPASGIEIWRVKHASMFETILLKEDLRNHRWFELSAIGRASFPDEPRFMDSLELASSNGSIIDEGENRILGDRGIDTSFIAPAPSNASETLTESSIQTPSETSSPLVIVSKVKARYTEEARRKNVQGSVTLRVTFLANGGIGEITVVKGLGHGLSEQAIAAARKIAFLPPRVDGRLATTSRPVSFTFNIY